MKTLKNLFLDQLAEMYEAEQHIAKALSWMTRLASDRELQGMLKVHASESLGHISKVAQVFRCFGEETVGSKSNAISGLLAEAEALVAQYEVSPARDAAILSALQKLEHYEIATYGCLQDCATVLNNRKAAILLEEILGEEKSGNGRLTDLSHMRNEDALGETEGEEEAELVNSLTPTRPSSFHTSLPRTPTIRSCNCVTVLEAGGKALVSLEALS